MRRPGGQISAIQRARMIAGALETVEAAGYARMTVAQIISRARVSRKTFYDVFEDSDQCFLEALDQALAEATELAREAYAGEACWQDGMRSALATLLELMDEAPGLAKVCVVETLKGGELILTRREQTLAELTRAVDAGRRCTEKDPPALAAEAVVGGVLAVLHKRLLQAEPEPFIALLGQLMSMIVLPYLGPAAARSELTAARSTPLRSLNDGSQSGSAKDPLEGLRIRLTYRTVMVLAAIARLPGASNREIAHSAGIIDQGQISKLLNRLAALGLVENHGIGQKSGGTNAWQLTERGVELERATRPRLTWAPARRIPQNT